MEKEYPEGLARRPAAGPQRCEIENTPNERLRLTARSERDNMSFTEYTSRLLPQPFFMASCRSEGSLRNNLVSLFLRLLMASVVLPLAGCIAHAPGSGGGGQQIQVAVASTPPSTTQLSVSTPTTPSTLQYTATVTGTGNQAVTWTLAADPSASVVCTATGTGLGTVTIQAPTQ